jgi:hypothetical protein
MADQPAALSPSLARYAPDGNLTPRRRRRFMIDMALRKQKPGTGSSPEFLRRRTAMNPWPDLRLILKDIPWAITDAVATRAYMPERMTRDLDILVLRQDCQSAWRRLDEAGYQVAPMLDAPYFVARSPEGIEIDVICAEFPWILDALTYPNTDPAGYPVLDLPYLVLMKLNANRAIDIGDLTRMLGLASEIELNRVRAAVQKFKAEDMQDLEDLITLGKREMEPPEGKQWWE